MLIFYIIFLFFLILLIFLSAIFSFSEMAISSSNKIRLLSIIESKASSPKKKKRARKVIHFINNYNEHITAIVIFNNMVNILFSTLATTFFILIANQYINSGNSDSVGPLMSFLITTPIIIIFGEIIPKQLAKKHAESGTMILSTTISIINILMKPFTFVLGKIIKEENKPAFLSDEEINMALSQTTAAGVTTLFEQKLIKKLLATDELDVKKAMIPVKDVVTIPMNISLQKLDLFLTTENYTRFPVVNKNGKVIAIFLSKKYLIDKLKNKAINFKDYQYNFSQFNDDENPFNILEALRNRREKMAIIVDEKDNFVGIVTLEDVIELIIGNIYDEDDIEKDGVYSLNESSYILDANVELNYWINKFSLNINLSQEIRNLTIEEWISSFSKNKLKHGDNFTFNNLIIWVREDKYNSEKFIYEIDII